jgi:DNA invertase Pin-like site-specific DNA recombinase
MTRRHTTPDTAAQGSSVLYVRVSTDEQARTGVSLDAQEERLRAYCTMRELVVATVIREEGVSGSKPLAKRPGGKRLLDTIAAGEATNVVALKLDRLFRNTADALTTTATWDRAGVGMHLVDYGGAAIDTRTAVGRMMLTMMAGFAQFQRDTISENTRTALTYKRDHGRASGPTPYGYDRVGDDLVPNVPEQATIAQVRAWRDEGLSLRAIAARLTDAGTPTKRGGKWYPRTVSLLLDDDLAHTVADPASSAIKRPK